MATVEDATIRTEVQDALSHLQTAYDREVTLEAPHDPRLLDAIFNLRNYFGAGNKSHAHGRDVSVGDHSEEG